LNSNENYKRSEIIRAKWQTILIKFRIFKKINLRLSALVAKNMKDKKQNKYDKAYLRIAAEWSKLSYCKRKQVGAIIVRDRMIISDGYNGTPSGFENCCEDHEGLTQWYVLHAEANAILKVARSTQSCDNATLYITLSPCKECSKLIHQSGIKRVVYQNGYRDTSGIDFLTKAGIEVSQIEELN
jgi:dCMP deaminase